MHALKHMYICKLHGIVSLIMFVIKYVYCDIIIRGMHSNNSFSQTIIIFAVPQMRTVGKQWHITYMQSHVTYMQYIFKWSSQTSLSQRSECDQQRKVLVSSLWILWHVKKHKSASHPKNSWIGFWAKWLTNYILDVLCRQNLKPSCCGAKYCLTLSGSS